VANGKTEGRRGHYPSQKRPTEPRRRNRLDEQAPLDGPKAEPSWRWLIPPVLATGVLVGACGHGRSAQPSPTTTAVVTAGTSVEIDGQTYTYDGPPVPGLTPYTIYTLNGQSYFYRGPNQPPVPVGAFGMPPGS
jgi:hypothetical protein